MSDAKTDLLCQLFHMHQSLTIISNYIIVHIAFSVSYYGMDNDGIKRQYKCRMT